MSLISRKHLLIALASGAMFVAACGDDDPPTQTDVGDAGDTGLDVSLQDTTDTGGGICAEDPELSCVRRSDCADSGLENPTCNVGTGCCEEGEVNLLPCASHLAACSSDEQSGDTYICDTEAGLCLQRCDSDTSDDNQSAECPISSFCLERADAEELGADELPGICFPGDCDTNIFDPEACGGVDTCIPVGNEASFCVTAGTVEEGGACGSNDDGTPLCATGLRCVEGECVQPCNRREGDAQCDAGETCVAAFDTTPRNQPGLCGVECDAFSTDQCGEGEACNPILGRYGINAWMCQPMPEGEIVEAGGDCTAENTVCAQGSICLAVTNTRSECTAMCDPLGVSTEPGASCGSGDEVGEELFPSIDEISASAYRVDDAGDVAAQIRSAADESLIANTTLVYAGGTLSSAVVTPDVEAGVAVFSINDLSEGDTLPTTGLRVIHAAPAADPVDVWLNHAPVEIAPGAETYIEDFSAENSWLFGELSIAGEAGHTYTVFATPEGVAVSDDVPATLAAGTAGIRFYNAGFGGENVDVYYDCSATVTTGTVVDCAGDSALIEDLAVGSFDDAGAFMPFGTESAGDMIFAVPAGTDPALAAASALAIEIPTLAEGDHLQLITTAGIGTVNGDFQSVEFPVEATDFTVAYTNFATAAASLEVAELFASDLASGTSSEGEASLFTALANGEYAITVGDFMSEIFTLEDSLVSIFIFANGEDVDTLAVTELPVTLDAGQGAVRFVHLAAGGGAVVVTAPAESSQVCAPSRLDGLGFCNEGCDPYPRDRGNYGCTEPSDTCGPFVARDDRPVDVQGYCIEDNGTVPAGGTCSTPGFLGQDCEDFAVCLELTEGGDAQCLPICQPFTTGGCAEYDDFSTCSGVPPLLGQQSLSFCIDAQPGAIGDRCSEEGTPCAADSSICLGGECLAVCRIGFDDCPGETQCTGGQLNPEVVPSYMGLCN